MELCAEATRMFLWIAQHGANCRYMIIVTDAQLELWAGYLELVELGLVEGPTEVSGDRQIVRGPQLTAKGRAHWAALALANSGAK